MRPRPSALLRPVACCQRFAISVLDSDDTEQADLRGGRSPWFATSGHPSRLEVGENLKCDALIVGAGITGSLVAERLTRQGLDVVIVDRELPGRGSTAASTSMLLWEIDRSLRAIERSLRFRARLARLSRQPAMPSPALKSLVRQLGIACDMRDKNSLYLAAGESSAGLIEEHRLRDARRPARRFSRPWQLLDIFGIARAGAIVSSGAADADPMQLAHGLLGSPLRAARGCSRQTPLRSMPPGARSMSVWQTIARSRRAPSFSRPAMSCPISFAPPCTRCRRAGRSRPRRSRKNLERWRTDLGRQQGLSLRANDAGRTDHHRRRGQHRDCRTRGARPPDPGEIARAGAKARGALAGREY